MTNQPDNAVTAVEFAVLARLSQPADTAPVTETELKSSLHQLKLFSKEELHSELSPAIESLKERELIRPVPRPPGSRAQRWALTDRGALTLRSTLGLSRTPVWKALFDRYLPALELGFASNADPGQATPGGMGSMSAAIVAARLGVSLQRSTTALCDELIVEALGMPAVPKGGLTLAAIRAWALGQQAQQADLEFRDNIKTAKDLQKETQRLAARILGVAKPDRAVFVSKLRNRALYKLTKLGTQNSGHAADTQTPATDQTLLTAVNEALPRIGSKGRHGPEKVFVSEIWRTIEGDRRLGDLSLDTFKRWLLEANRRRLIDLARADLVGVMDGTLVAASEIREPNFGATFHFVLDRHADLPGSDRGLFHAGKA